MITDAVLPWLKGRRDIAGDHPHAMTLPDAGHATGRRSGVARLSGDPLPMPSRAPVVVTASEFTGGAGG